MEGKKPETRFEFICEWFERAATNSKAQGRNDSALLWQDGLAHLRYVAEQRDELLEALEKAQSYLDGLITPCNSAGVIASELEAVIAKAGAK